MKNSIKMSITALCIMGTVGCAMPLASAGPGSIYTETTEGVMAQNGQKMSKKGEACTKNILGIVSIGDSTIETAKREGRISNIATIDRSYFGILGVYSKACTIVKGN